jgi:hypothetical protein
MSALPILTLEEALSVKLSSEGSSAYAEDISDDETADPGAPLLRRSNRIAAINASKRFQPSKIIVATPSRRRSKPTS